MTRKKTGEQKIGRFMVEPSIPADQVERVQALYWAAQALKAQYERAKAEYEPAERALIAAVEAGVKPALGAPAFIVEVEQRRNIKWKEAYVALNGQEAADRVVLATEPTTYKRVKFQ